MSIKISFNGASINKPGAYSALKVSPLTGFPLVTTGIVGIIGPSDAGVPGFAGPFTQSSIQNAKTTYRSGPIADALDLLVNPSNDARIVNGASEIYIYKVNSSTQSSLALATGWGTLTSKYYGLTANQVSAKIEDSQAEVKPSVSFTYAAPATDATFSARVNGGAVVSVSILAADTASVAAGKIDGLTGISASESGGIITVTLTSAAAAGIGLSLEIIDGGGTDLLTTIGISGSDIGVIKSSTAERQSQITLNHPDTGEEISDALGGEIVMEIGYVGTTATLTISDTQLTTSVVGGAGSNLAITFADYNNLQEVVDYINAQTGYTCSTSYAGATTTAPTLLDNVSGVGICSTASSLKPGRIKADSYLFADYLNEISQLVTVTQTSKLGLPDVMTLTYLAGGTLGAAANSDFQAGFNAFKQYRMNTVIPLIAADGSSEGYGTYDWDTVSAQFKTHINWGWSTLGKSERNGFIGKDDTKANLIAAAKIINSGYISLCGQKIRRVNAQGNLVYLPEWSMACVCAGLQAGSDVGEPITYKYINASGISQDTSWNPKVDFSEVIDGGITFAEEVDSGGYRIVVGNTTYGKDTNFVWNRVSVVEAGGYVAYDLRTTLENQFTGIKAATGSATAILNFCKARMTEYLNSDIIVADDNAPLGYKDLSVEVSGNQAIINVTVYPVQGIDFILPTIYLDNATQTAA